MKRPTNANAGVSLFPFLAVLLCTMGALVLLLMLIASQSKAQAEAARALAAKPKVDLEAVRRREEDLQWKIDQLAKSRDKTIADVAEHRAQLAHLEEHAARLKKQLADLEAAEALLKSQKSTDESGRAAVAADLAELRRKIEEAEKKLAAEKVAGRKPQAFAVVPYDGDKGTRRRPIYIECRGDAIILQPEGIVFHEVDFSGSLGPSNPLATCVRLVSEYLTRGESYREGEQPYPLLLVRPSGIGSYYAARAGMSSWEGEFGYELIDENWPLEFPPADPLLTQMANKAVEEARVRQVMLARAAPSLRGKGPKATFRVSPTSGGIVQVDGGQSGYGSREARYSANRGPRGSGGGAGPSGGAAGGGAPSGPRGGGGYSADRLPEDRYASVSGGNSNVPPGVGNGLDGTGPGNSAGGLVAVSPTLNGGPSDNRYGNSGNGSAGYGTGAGGASGTGPVTGTSADDGNGPGNGYAPIGGGVAGAGESSGVPASGQVAAGQADGAGGPSLGAPANGMPSNSMPANGVAGDNAAANNGANSYVGGGVGGMSAADANRYPQSNQYSSTGNGPNGNNGASAPPPGSMSNGYSSTRSSDGSESGGAQGSSDGAGSSNSNGSPNGTVAGSGGQPQSGGAGASGAGSNASSGVAGTSGSPSGDGPSSPFGSSGAGGGSPIGMPGGSGSQTVDLSQAKNAATSQVPPPGPGEYVESIANKRGKNWGLPEESRRSTPLTRPIQVYCSGNQLTLFSDKGIPDKQIVMDGPTENSVDTLVSTVWDQVTTWGIAGRGMYWKPKLVVHVSPDGATRFNDLKQLLEGSGLEVTGKQIAVAQPVAAGRR